MNVGTCYFSEHSVMHKMDVLHYHISSHNAAVHSFFNRREDFFCGKGAEGTVSKRRVPRFNGG